jgi:hypothetical protein
MSNPSHPVTLVLTSKQAAKVRLIQQAISEPTTYHKVLDGLIDTGFATALKTLYEDGELDQQNYRKGLKQLPDYLRRSFAADQDSP